MASSDIQQNLAEHGLSVEDYDVDLDMNAAEGIAVGDHVECVEDFEDHGVFAGDEGEVLAFYHQGPSMFGGEQGIFAVVKFDGMDPTGVPARCLEALA